MATKTAVIQFHRATAECWRAKGRPLFVKAHEDRADELEHSGGVLTDIERSGDENDIMGEIARTVRL